MLIYGPVISARRHNTSCRFADAFIARARARECCCAARVIHEWETGRLCDTRMSVRPLLVSRCHSRWFGSRMLHAEDAPSLREMRALSWFLHPSRRTVWALRDRPRPAAGTNDRSGLDFALEEDQPTLLPTTLKRENEHVPFLRWSLESCDVKANLKVVLDNNYRLLSISSEFLRGCRM